MMTFSCSGTLGDAYVTLCKLKTAAIAGPVLCNHYTTHKKLRPQIKKIYSLLPNVTVKFVNKRDEGHQKIVPLLSEPYGNETPFPALDIFCPKTLQNCVVLAPKSGKDWESRCVPTKDIGEIVGRGGRVIIVGTDRRYASITGDNVKNLVGKTDILEAMGIAAAASEFIGFQGLLCYVAMGARVPTRAYVNGAYRKSFQLRTHDAWQPYCTEVSI